MSIATPPSEPPRPDPLREIRGIARAGVAAIVVVVATAGAWAVTAPLAGAVIAPAQIVVESNVRRVQHPTGGVVAEIRVVDGDHVKAGDLVVRLDETVPRANLAVIEAQLLQLWARKARLETERDDRDAVPVPPFLAQRGAETPEVAQVIAGETSVFRTRRDTLAGQQQQMRERVAQTREEIRGLASQIASKREQIRLIGAELEGVRELYKKNLVPYTRLTTLEREAARLAGEEGQLIAETARANGRIAETELQIMQLVQDRRREVAADLRDTETKIADLAERRVAAVDQLSRVDVRAPQTGIVHQKSVHTVGGVVAPGEQMMLIVPERDRLIAEARIEPQMIDRVKIGQAVKLRFTAFDTTTTPDVDGTLVHVAADLTKDPQTGVPYYVARVAIAEDTAARLRGKTLLPGMPVEAYIQTGTRTAFAYLRKPLEDQLARTFRHD
ncbi:HlyD family type I secretion periplasmic adaptor subunit [Rhodoplanes azumiensis]|uniref:Membrane fusion protein (MFP) family protein n=1 Tax=Rhodoplanes azumiensis TaxID=1897628 RepID=A0ABW5APY6_9BRAD